VILSGLAVSDHQACARRTALNADWRVLRWRPKALFDACLRRAIVHLGNGFKPEDVAADAVATYMQAAANPGLDVQGQDTYVLAKDWCVMLEILVRFLSTTTIMQVHEIPEIPLGSYKWQPMSQADESGVLHRWITTARWDEDDLARELHSWYSFGDIVMTGQVMKLHVIEIGQTRNGRQVGPWATGWKAPIDGFHLRFRRIDGKSFNGWTKLHLAALPADYDGWVEKMRTEGMASLMHHLEIKCPDPATLADSQRQLEEVADQIKAATRLPWQALPMSRGACDGLIPCPWQHACYGTTKDLTQLGLYQPRKSLVTA
jgi:hypothetical protein